MIAITFALPTESSDLVRRLESKRIGFTGDVKILHGQLQHREVAIVHTGVGRKSCERHINAFLKSVRPEVLISSGFAGSLIDGLNVGDLIVAKNYSDPALVTELMEGEAPATPENSGSSELDPPSKQLRVRAVNLATVELMVDSIEERARLAHEHGADAVDMETEVIAQECAKHGIPMLSLRVISDSPTAPFPAPPHVLFDVARQRPIFSKLIRYVVTHPSAIAMLLRFSRFISQIRALLAGSIVYAVAKIR